MNSLDLLTRATLAMAGVLFCSAVVMAWARSR
jgi:hypothetical protein